MKAVTTEQMRALDARTIAAGTPADELMERAGRAVAQQVLALLQHSDSRAVFLFAGKGNNGGDAIIAARHLAAAGYDATLVLVEPRPITDFAGLTICSLDSLPAQPPAVVVDGLLGTGLTGSIREPYATAIQRINSLGAPVLAIDIPSGLGTGTCVRATRTITIGLPKIDLLQSPDEVGELVVADIGLLRDVESEIELITAADIAPLLPPRKRTAHKGDFGHLLILAGSEGYTGAPVLCAHAAARAGAGRVTLAVPRTIYPIVAAQCPPEIMPRPMENLDYDRYDAIAIGPGIGCDTPWLFPLITGVNKPLILDADALTTLAGNLGVLKKARAILTPHPGEMARLTGRPVTDRWQTARDFARQHNIVLALKGAGTVVAAATGPLWINSTGNPGMAKGGMGDALTGIIGALVAQGLSPLDATQAGVFLHGRAGDLAAERFGQSALLTTDLIAHLSGAFQFR